MSDGEPRGTEPEDGESEPQTEPTFAELLFANLRVVGGVLALAAVAFALWRALAWLFPEVEWLQLRR